MIPYYSTKPYQGQILRLTPADVYYYIFCFKAALPMIPQVAVTRLLARSRE
jgi:hypothetical protein